MTSGGDDIQPAIYRPKPQCEGKLDVSVHRFRCSEFRGFELQSSPSPLGRYVLSAGGKGRLLQISSNRIILIYIPLCLDTEMAWMDSVHQSTEHSLREPGTLNIEPLNVYKIRSLLKM